MASADVAAGRKRERPESSSTTPSSSGITSSGINYQVFLNFRDIDTHKGFASFLHRDLERAGIEVFKDDEKLSGGEEISQARRDAIKQSRISIAIFSNRYASSKYCLMELEQMWECRRPDEHTLIPIFYDVSPDTVKHQTGNFETSFEKHKEEGKVDANTIQKWREVLQQVGKLAGYVLADVNRGDEATLLEKVLKRVKEVLDEDDQYVTDKLVGIDLCVQEMMTKLGVVYSHGEATKVCGEDVRVVGICGMPGVGKSTLAKIVYKKIHKLFNACSFLEDINSKGVEVPLDLLIAELQKEKHDPQGPFGIGIKKMKSRFINALIVLDNVHEDKQIEALVEDLSWLGQGSRIIVTTNRRDVLKVFDNVVVEECKVEPMGIYYAHKLFRKHAFRGDANPDDPEYNFLSRDIVEALGGFPMVIIFWANYLKRKKNLEIWRSTRDSLRDHLHGGKVEAALNASYDSLNEYAKEIFLDIACFFIGKDERIASYMWKACGCYPPLEIEKLRDIHFLEDGENNELRMHKLLRDFGRKIVARKVLQERCRIWNFSDACSILEDGQHNESVQGISLQGGEAGTVRLTCEALRKISNLRYLRLDGATIKGTCENLLPNLRWLDWRECHFIPELCYMDLKKLLILDLSGSQVTEYSQDWRQIMKKAKDLKVLNLQGCNLLRVSWESSASTDLEMLKMEDCIWSNALNAFICQLKLLKSLNLRNCGGVHQLGRQLLHGKEFLTELLIDGTNIEVIHIGNDSLKNLEVLSACDCKKLEYIYPIGHLTKLKSLALDGAINWHPGAFEFPPNLERLSLAKCEKLSGLPHSIGMLKRLEIMDLSETRIMEMPPSVKYLSSLKLLKMKFTCLEKFPVDIVNLKKLEEIDFSCCIYLEAQDSCDISGLSCLRILRLSGSIVAGLPQGICDLPCLQTLDVRKCERLQALPELPSSLVSLRWGSRNMKVLDLSYLTNLKELCLNSDEQPEGGSSSQTPNVEWITRLPSLETLQLSVSKVTNLPGNFSALTQLRELSLSYMKELDLTQLPSSPCLWILHLRCCKIQEPNFSGLKYLSELEIKDCDLPEIDGLADLKLLEVLKIYQYHCGSITNLDELKNLYRLRDRLRVLTIIQGSVVIADLNKLVDVKQPKDGVEAAIESMEKMKDVARQRPADKEASDRNYAIATVQNIVGIDGCVEQITDLLETEVNDEVRIIGIYGADGSGKTTLAKAVYNRISSCFDRCSFLAEVKETTQNPRGVQFLQTKLIGDILERNWEGLSFDERIQDFLDMFCEMKVLIVVDDVEEQSHLHAIVGDPLRWFGPGSRIIVTSKNSGILKDYGPDKAPTYMVSELDDGQAFEIFCKHAFRMQSSIPDYDGLSNRIVSATAKLPLAVEVVGSFLRGKSTQEWEKMEKSMKACAMSSQTTTVGLEEILDLCYQELEQQQKDIFLDIACFMSGVDARIAPYMWPNCNPSSGCILMPLAKIGENNELQMHRLLRCLSKRIFKQEGSGDPSSRRFCTQDMVLKAMNREKGIENVEARDSCMLTAADFASMPAISFLKLDDAKVLGDFTGAFPSLKWLCWQRCPPDFSAENFFLTELVILDLSWSKITEEWRGWSEIKMEKLKVLNLTGCSDLLITPDFSGYKDLEILILERCSHLVKLHPSISHLKRLVSLNLKICSQLNGLPEELGCMTALKELFIDGTSVQQIPISIGNLKQLEILSGFECIPLTCLPSSISYLTSLSELSLDGADITELPSSLGDLLKLRRLSLRGCFYFGELPYSVGKLVLLEELDISGTNIAELPNSIGNLESLRVLRMDYSVIGAFPGEIGNLTNLEELHASWCRDLKGALPSYMKGLHRLRSLTLGYSSISSLPPEISAISGLHVLDLLQCNEIEELPKLPPSLICLRVSSKRMKAIPLLGDLKELKELCLSDGDRRARRPPSEQPMPESNVQQMINKPSFSISFPKLRKLKLSLSQVTKLKFEPTDIPQLKMLILSGLSLEEVSELPKTLSLLSVQGCSSLKRLPTVQGLNNLSTFELYDSAIEEIEGLEGLKALKRLDISNCKIRSLYGIGQLTSLSSLILSYCDYLDGLPDLSNLTSLKVLEIRRCKMIHQIEGLEELTSLEKLNISACPAENSVQVQNMLKNLKERSVEKWGHGDFIKQVATSLKRNREEILLDTSNKRMKKIEDERGEQAAGMETSDRNYAIAAIQNVVGTDDCDKEITDSLEVEVNDESIKKIAGQQPVDMGTSDRNYAIAAVQNVVGIDDRARQITHLLEMEVNDEVRIIGIHGTDGIGKTTLAKAVYERISSCFDSCSFLTEVEETTQNPRGIQFLQTKLIHDILERDHEDPSFDETIEDFVDIFREMKVLIVVDAVEKPSDLHAIVGDPLHWFGPGSRIIVTSQNEEILKGNDPEKACNYMVDELDDGQAFESFCKHAFRMQSSIPDYDGLSNRIVNATEKLPLAVEVVGSFLRGKSIQEWEKMEKSMKARTMSSQKTTVGLEEILDICYEELGPQQKDIFLDIARFISGVDARIASYMWPNCYPSSGCILMPLAKIGENNELQMHRLLRCLFKRISKPEGSGDPSSGRFCTQDMVLKAMNKEKGIGEFEARDSCIVTAENFAIMPAISFLKLDDATVSGDFTGAFPSLRWLCWQRVPPDFSAKNFVLRALIILDLSWSKVTEDWRGWSEIKMEKLKVLNLTGCSDLLITPDFSDYKNLEILILEQCSHLVKIDPSIGHLKCLVSLNLKFCSQLNGLPVELGCTAALKELYIDGTSVQKIPISIGNLKQLEILSGLKCFPLTHLPSSICYLASLFELSLDGAKISELPSSLGELLKLRRLSLRDCRYLEKLPYTIGEMRSLEELDISATSISELPDSIRKLKNLRVLRMDSSFIRAIPGEIGNLTKLEELHASWCRSLKGAIPGDIEALHRLRSLTLGHSSISSLPPEVSTISGLHTLDLIQCNEIEELPKLPPSLICLRVSSKRMKAIPLLGNSKKLEELFLSDGDPKARRPPSAIEGIEGLEGLKALKRLDISNCKIQHIDGIGQLTSLSSLILSYCDYLGSLPDLSNLKSLKVLEIRRCKLIHHIEGLEKLTSLEKLNISGCLAENLEQVRNARKDVRARLKGKLCTG